MFINEFKGISHSTCTIKIPYFALFVASCLQMRYVFICCAVVVVVVVTASIMCIAFCVGRRGIFFI